MEKKSTLLAPSYLFINLVRIGVVCLCIATALYIFWPAVLGSFAESLPLREALVEPIKNYPGFDQDWLSIVNLITASIYIYAYLAVILIAMFLYLIRVGTPRHNVDRDQWNLLVYIIMGRLDSNSTPDAWNETSAFSSSSYSINKKRIASFLFGVLTIFALTYIGYDTLLKPPTYAGIFARIVDAVFVGFWCYCIFSILMSLIFVLTSRLLNLQSFSLK